VSIRLGPRLSLRLGRVAVVTRLGWGCCAADSSMIHLVVIASLHPHTAAASLCTSSSPCARRLSPPPVDRPQTIVSAIDAKRNVFLRFLPFLHISETFFYIYGVRNVAVKSFVSIFLIYHIFLYICCKNVFTFFFNFYHVFYVCNVFFMLPTFFLFCFLFVCLAHVDLQDRA